MRKKDRSKVSVGNTTLQGQDSRRRGPRKKTCITVQIGLFPK